MVETKQDFMNLFNKVFDDNKLISNEELEKTTNSIENDFIKLKESIYWDINESLKIYNKEYSNETFNLRTIEKDKDMELSISDINNIDKIIAFINQFENIVSYLDTLKNIDKQKYIVNLFYFTYIFDFDIISSLCWYYSSEDSILLKDLLELKDINNKLKETIDEDSLLKEEDEIEDTNEKLPW